MGAAIGVRVQIHVLRCLAAFFGKRAVVEIDGGGPAVGGASAGDGEGSVWMEQGAHAATSTPAGMPSPALRRRIMASVRGRLPASTSYTRLRAPM